MNLEESQQNLARLTARRAQIEGTLRSIHSDQSDPERVARERTRLVVSLETATRNLQRHDDWQESLPSRCLQYTEELASTIDAIESAAQAVKDARRIDDALKQVAELQREIRRLSLTSMQSPSSIMDQLTNKDRQ